MKKLLLSGFEPFLDNRINPTQKVVSTLNGQIIGNYQVVGKILPVDFQQSFSKLLKFYNEMQADAVLMLGLAKGRCCVTVERIAINCDDAVCDNAGFTPHGEVIDPNGSDGYFSTLPIYRIVEALKAQNYPAQISNSAGTYLCNHIMYGMLNYLKKSDRRIPAGFIHLPASHELAALNDVPVPSWSNDDLKKSVEIIIGELI